MNLFSVATVLTLTFGLAATAQAEYPTKQQLAEFQQLVETCKATRATTETCLKKLRTAVTYTVKRRCDLAVAIKAGKYDRVIRYFTPENFPTPDGCVEGEEVEVRLFSPQELGQEDGNITTKESETAMGKRECSPIDWTLLLPLGEKYPELQRKFRIAGLGSVWRDPVGLVIVPLLRGDGGGRLLYLRWDDPDNGWRSVSRLAASCE